jgi:hypothetical protein
MASWSDTPYTEADVARATDRQILAWLRQRWGSKVRLLIEEEARRRGLL